MKTLKLRDIQILPHSKRPEFEQRESSRAHTSYLEETAFFSMGEKGDVEGVKRRLEESANTGIVIGHLSDSSLRQIQYWAVCCVTLGIRYAIQGGLDEMQAFNLSDRYIMRIDSICEPAAIPEYLAESVIELTCLVRNTAQANCPLPIRRCLGYIGRHLHESIRLPELAKEAGVSEDYLSKLFKKQIGQTVSGYILQKKLEEAKTLLSDQQDARQVAYLLGFCSQSYFIACFKKAYGVTPHRFAVFQGKG